MEQQEQLLTWINRGFQFIGPRSFNDLQATITGLNYILFAVGDWETMSALIGMQDGEAFRLIRDPNEQGNVAYLLEGKIVWGEDDDISISAFLHEIGHFVDYNMARLDTFLWSEKGLLGLGWEQIEVGWRQEVTRLVTNEYSPYSKASPVEDFADTFTAWVLTENGKPLPDDWKPLTLERYQALTVAIDQIRDNLP